MGNAQWRGGSLSSFFSEKGNTFMDFYSNNSVSRLQTSSNIILCNRTVDVMQ
jgi:hypothetical protein